MTVQCTYAIFAIVGGYIWKNTNSQDSRPISINEHIILYYIHWQNFLDMLMHSVYHFSIDDNLFTE